MDRTLKKMQVGLIYFASLYTRIIIALVERLIMDIFKDSLIVFHKVRSLGQDQDQAGLVKIAGFLTENI